MNGHRNRYTAFGLVPALLLAASVGAWAQGPQTLRDMIQPARSGVDETAAAFLPEIPIEEAAAEVQKRLETARERYAVAQERQAGEVAVQFGVKPEEAVARMRLLRSVVRAHERQLDTLRKLDAVRNAFEELAKERGTWQGFPDPPPYSIDLADRLRDDIHAKKMEMAAVEAEQRLVTDGLRANQAALQRAEEETRAARDALDKARGHSETTRQRWLLELAELRLESARADAARLELDRLMTDEAAALHRGELDFLAQKLSVVAANAPFPPEELEAKLATLAAAQEARHAEIQAALDADENAQAALAAAREALRALREGPPPPEDEAARHSEALARAQALVDARRIRAETSTLAVEALKVLLDMLHAEESIWRHRHDVAQTAETAELDAKRVLVADALDQLALWRDYFDSNLQLTLTLVANQEQRLANWRPEDGDSDLARQILDAYEQREALYRRGSTRLNEVERLLQRWQDELAERRADLPWSERARTYAAVIWGGVSAAWNYSFMNVADKGVTISKVVKALFLLVVGLWVCKRLAARIRRLTVDRFHAEESVAVPIEKAVYYVLILSVVLFALNVVEIPLTVFAFFGGAIAIGAGFGAQNLINNFISGIIMLLERPIKVGDIVEVDGMRGRVVTIGARCSQLRMFDGVDMLVPNSSFLEKNVTNWTLADAQRRFSVSVGVAYGSSTRETARLIMKAVEEHGLVLKEPPPVVVFHEFGDNALQFVAYYWVELGKAVDSRVIASDIRHRIDRLFREAGIVIAFPQRDIHVDTLRPLRIEMVEPGTDDADAQEDDPNDGPRLPDADRST